MCCILHTVPVHRTAQTMWCGVFDSYMVKLVQGACVDPSPCKHLVCISRLHSQCVTEILCCLGLLVRILFLFCYQCLPTTFKKLVYPSTGWYSRKWGFVKTVGFQFQKESWLKLWVSFHDNWLRPVANIIDNIQDRCEGVYRLKMPESQFMLFVQFDFKCVDTISVCTSTFHLSLQPGVKKRWKHFHQSDPITEHLPFNGKVNP